MMNYSEEELNRFTKLSTDFDCLPRETQIIIFVEFLLYQGNTLIKPDEVLELFNKVDLRVPSSGKSIRINTLQIEKYIDRLIAKGRLPLLRVDEETYRLTNGHFDGGSFYKMIRNR